MIDNIASKHKLAVARNAAEPLALNDRVKHNIVGRQSSFGRWLLDAMDDEDLCIELHEKIGVYSVVPLTSAVTQDLISAAFTAGVELHDLFGDDATKYTACASGGLWIVSKYDSLVLIAKAVADNAHKSITLTRSLLEEFGRV